MNFVPGTVVRITALFLFGILLSACRQTDLPADLMRDPMELHSGWSQLREDFPGSASPPSGSYQPLPEPGRLCSKDCGTNWYRVTLPEFSWKRPALFFGAVFLDLTVYLDGVPVYGDPNAPFQFRGVQSQLVELPQNASGKEIVLRIRSPGNVGGLHSPIFLDSMSAIVRWRESFFTEFYMAGIALLIMGLPGFFIWFRSSKNRVHGVFSFSVFSSLTGLWFLAASETTFPRIDGVARFLFVNAMYLSWPIGFLHFFRSFFGSGSYRIVDYLIRIQWATLITTILMLLAGFVSGHWAFFEFWSVYPQTTSMMVLIAGLTFVSGMEFRKAKKDARFILFMFLIPAIGGTREILGDTGFFDKTRVYYHYSVLLFVMLLGLMTLRRILSNYESLIQTRKNLDLTEKALGRAQIQTLQDRMNPHFILNSLATIHGLLESGKVEEAERSLILLSEHYRYLTDRSFASLVPLEDELDFAITYMEIQKIRFADTLHFESSISKKIASDLFIVPLSIQPLLENAIKHGIRKRKGAGLIRLNVEPNGPEGICLTVEDDGPGPSDEDHYGRSLGNTLKRLAYHFVESRLELEKRGEGWGSRVTLSYSHRR